MPTTFTDADPDAFIAAVTPAARRRDAETLCALLRTTTNTAPRMYGTSIVGFGEQRTTTGKRVDVAPALAFSPRKTALVLYLTNDIADFADELAQLGPHTTGVGCLYVKDLADVDVTVLERLLEKAWAAKNT